MSNHGTPRRGFTLIELLVVIAVIAILAAILFPIFAQARDKARQVGCLSNLRQIGLATQLYAQDYDETPPPRHVPDVLFQFGDPKVYAKTPNFLGSILPYTTTRVIFYCPSAIWNLPYAPKAMTPTTLSDTNLLGNGVVIGRPLAVIDRPAEVIYIQELNWRIDNAQLRPAPVGSGATFTAWHYTSPIGEGYSNLHQGGGNFVFEDGHVKFKHHLALRSGDFGLVPDQPWSTTNEGKPDGAKAFTARF